MSTYLVVRCHARKQKLIPPEDMRRLLESKSLKELVDKLVLTEYWKKVGILRELTAESLYNAYTEVLKERLEWFYHNASKAHKRFLREYCRKFEVENVCGILRRKVTKTPVEVGRLVMLDFLELDYKPLIEAETVEDCLKVLSEVEMYREPSIRGLELYERYKTLLPVEAELKKAYYEAVFEALDALSGMDRAVVGEILGAEVDVENCFTATAPFLYGYSPELVKGFLVRRTFQVPLANLIKAVEAGSREEILKLLKPYREVVEAMLDGREEVAYALARRRLRKMIPKRMPRVFTSIAYAIMCMRLCEDEWRDLCFVTYAVELNIPREHAAMCLICG